MRCKHCGYELDPEDTVCPNCGVSLEEDDTPPRRSSSRGQSGGDPFTKNRQVPQETRSSASRASSGSSERSGGGSNGMAIAGFILSLLGPLAFIGLILSIVGLVKSKQLGGAGKGFAIAGLVISIISLVGYIMYFAIFIGAIGEIIKDSAFVASTIL